MNILTILFSSYKKLEPEFESTIPGSKANLTILMYLSSPSAKLDALDRLISLPTLQAINPITSDQLLPWLIQALTHCQIYTLYSQLDFMTKFNLTQDVSQQDLFNLATFEAALEHLKDSCDRPLPDNLWSTTDKELDDLFHAIYQDDVEQVQSCLETTSDVEKCHPLCDCDTCAMKSQLISIKDDSR